MLAIQFSVHESSDSTLVLNMPGRDGQRGDWANVMLLLWRKEVLQWHNLLSLPRRDDPTEVSRLSVSGQFGSLSLT